MEMWKRTKLFVANKLRFYGPKRALPLIRERKNDLLYKGKPPLYAECLWVNPQQCKKSIRIGSQTFTSGKIIKKKRVFRDYSPVTEDRIIQKCLEHWVEGKSWEETGLVDDMMSLINRYGSYDGCSSREEVIDRYRKLDKLYERTKALGRLKSKEELDEDSFREEGGILMHIGPSGELFFGGNGNHRMAIALALKLEIIPVQLGGVYVLSLPYLKKLRSLAKSMPDD